MARFTGNGQPLQHLHTITLEDGTVVEYQTTARDFWVRTPDGQEHQLSLGKRETDDPDHHWWRSVRQARKERT